MNKKLIIAVTAVLAATAVIAGPHDRHRPGYGPRPAPMHHHHGGYHFGHAGRNFWPGFVGGVVGVQTTASRVWVPGGWSYSTDCYGVTRRIYTSGHYEVIR